jgi:WD40 repeat protein
VAENVLFEFENRLARLQSRFDYHFARTRRQNSDRVRQPHLSYSLCESPHGPVADLANYYVQFFETLECPCLQLTDFARLKELKSIFSVIAQVELGDAFYRTAMFTLNSNGSVRVQVNWHYLYLNRHYLERNWRMGCYETEVIDGAPDVSPPSQREGIYCVSFDRFYLAAGSRDHTIRLWEMETMQFQRSLHSHEASVLCLQLDSERNMLVSGSSDSTIKIWDIAQGEVVQTLKGHSESVLGLQFEDKYIVSCSRDATARIWALCDGVDPVVRTENLAGGRVCENNRAQSRYALRHVLRGHRAAVNSVHIVSTTIATASGDRTVRLWNLITGAAIRTIGAHSRGIACVNIAGDQIVTGSSDHVIRIFNIETGEELRVLRGHSGLVRTIQTDNTKIISGSYDQSIRVWDLKSGEMLQELSRCHDSKYIFSMFILTKNLSRSSRSAADHILLRECPHHNLGLFQKASR